MELARNTSINAFANICLDIINIVIAFLGLSDMLRLGRTCKMFLKTIEVHPIYNRYLECVNFTLVMSSEEIKAVSISRLDENTFLKLQICKVVDICYQTNDLTLLKHHFCRNESKMMFYYMMYTVSKLFDLATIIKLLSDTSPWCSRTVYEYGCIGAIIAKREDLVSYFLKKGASTRVRLLAAAYSGDVTFIKCMDPIPNRDTILEMFNVAIIGCQVDVIKAIINDFSIPLDELRDEIDCSVIDEEKTYMMDYLLSIGLISVDEVVKWGLERNNFKYLENISQHSIIDWNEQCIEIADDDFRRDENSQRAFLFAAKRIPIGSWCFYIFMDPVFEEGLEYFVKERQRTWDYFFVKCCKEDKLEAAKFCLGKIHTDKKEITLLMGLEGMDRMIQKNGCIGDCVEMKKWIFDSLNELRKRKNQGGDSRCSKKKKV